MVVDKRMWVIVQLHIVSVAEKESTLTNPVRPHSVRKITVISCIQQALIQYNKIYIVPNSGWHKMSHIEGKNGEGTGDLRKGPKQWTSPPTIQRWLLDSGKQQFIRITQRMGQLHKQTKEVVLCQCGRGDGYVYTAPFSCSGPISGPSARHGTKQTGESWVRAVHRRN